MNAVLKTFLSMSFSGGLLILALLLGKRSLKDRISRQWQYYIWLIVIFRLLLPFGPKADLLGKTYRAVDQAIAQTAPQQQRPAPDLPGDLSLPPASLEHGPGSGAQSGIWSSPGGEPAVSHPLQEIGALLAGHIWLIWLTAALGLLIRKVTIYQGFIRYIKAGSVPVSDLEILDQLSIAAEQAGVKKPVELCVDPLVASPLLIGFFHPCIVLPSLDISEKDFQYTVLHELTHYKRRDMLYKWLVQATVCLHWFNPLVHLMSWEITKACEFSCDEAVLAKLGRDSAQDYGKTLLDAMAAVGRYKEDLGAVTLSEDKQLLKERLGAIMKFKKKSMAIRLLTGALTLCMMFGAAFVGVYPTADAKLPDPVPAERSTPPQTGQLTEMETLDFKGTTYYLVQNEAQLRAIGTGKYGMDLDYMQQADISLSAGDWVPIGTWDAPFTGTYNGNGFEITGLTMTDPNAKIVGLFGVAKNAHIYNVTLRDLDIASAGKNVSGRSVGAVLAIGQGSRSYDNFVYPKETTVSIEDNASEIDRHYKAGSLPLFAITFPYLDETAQKAWLEKLYAEGDFAFFSVAVRGLDTNSSLLAGLAEKAYADEEIAFFSTLTDYMNKTELELWLDRALEDGNWIFQSMLFDRLDREDGSDGPEKEWAKAQIAEYEKVGITMVDEKTYYYQGQLVGIFLDIRKEGSFYTLNMDPAGTVDIKIVRDANDKITGAAYMTKEEVAELLGDMYGPDDLELEIIPVDLDTVAAGGTIFLGGYTLSAGDKILYDISAGTGDRMKVFFAKEGQADPVYWSVDEIRQPGEKLKCIADFTVGAVPSAMPGTYRLYLQAPDSALGDVKGSISILSSGAA